MTDIKVNKYPLASLTDHRAHTDSKTPPDQPMLARHYYHLPSELILSSY